VSVVAEGAASSSVTYSLASRSAHTAEAQCTSSTKGEVQEEGHTLVCDAARRGNGCEKKAWRYSDFESSFLCFVQELKLHDVSHGDEQSRQHREVREHIAALTRDQHQLQAKREATYDLITAGYSTSWIASKLTGCDVEIASIQKEIERLEHQAATVATDRDGDDHHLKSLIARMRSERSHETYKPRAEIALQLKRLVIFLNVGSVGGGPMRKHVPEWLPERDDLVKFPRFVIVMFKNGTGRLIVPDAKNPLKLKMQIYIHPPEEVGRHPRASKTFNMPMLLSLGEH